MTTKELERCEQYFEDNYNPETGLTVNVKYNGETTVRNLRVEKLMTLNGKLTIFPDSQNVFTYTFINKDTVLQQFQNPIL